MKPGGLKTVFLFVFFLASPPAFAENSAGLTPQEGDKEKIDKALGKAPYSPYADRKYPMRPATPTCTLVFPWMPASGVRGSHHVMPIALRVANR
jgi:hypothetical protein